MSGQGDANERARMQRDRLSRLVDVRAAEVAGSGSIASIPRSRVGQANQQLTVQPRGGQVSNWRGGRGQHQQQLQGWPQQQQQQVALPLTTGQNQSFYFGSVTMNYGTINMMPSEPAPKQTSQNVQSGIGAVLQHQPAGVTKTLSRTQRNNAAKKRLRQRRRQDRLAGQTQGESQGNAAADDEPQANAADDGVPDVLAVAAVAPPPPPPPPPPSMPVVPDHRTWWVWHLEFHGRAGLADLVDREQRNDYATVIVPWYARRIAQQYGPEDQGYLDLLAQAAQVQQPVVQWCWMRSMWSAEFNVYYDAVYAPS